MLVTLRTRSEGKITSGILDLFAVPVQKLREIINDHCTVYNLQIYVIGYKYSTICI